MESSLFLPNSFSNTRVSLFKRLLKTIDNNSVQINSVVDIGSTDIISVTKNEIALAVNFLKSSFGLNNNADAHSYFDDAHNSLSVGYLWALKDAAYQAIDIGGAYGALNYDLNENFYDKYAFNKQFDLVSSVNGTLEHVFNQYSCFCNIHNLCKQGGIIALQVTADGDIDHGLYSYQPNFFTVLSHTNNYQILDLNVNVIDKTSGETIFYDYPSGEFNDVFNKNECLLKKNQVLHIYFIAKKLSDNVFVAPIQECYVRYINDLAIASKYFLLYNNLTFGQEICIFGTKRASEIAYKTALQLGFIVKYFVDDFNEGTHKNGTQIITWQSFIESGLVLFVGPSQSGITKERENECKIVWI